jgi:hypothetical protein
METDPDSGTSSRAAFAYLDRDTCSWRTCQGSLLEDSGEFCTTWPNQGTWDAGYAYEPRTSEPLTDASEFSFSRLLPTPDANYYNDGQTPEAYLERKRRELEKGYNGNGGGTTLAMTARLLREGIDPDAWKDQLLPTPSANDHTGAETREARYSRRGPGGDSLRDLPHLLPTPTTQDGENVAGQSQLERNSLPLNAAVRLLPTPTSQDAKQNAENAAEAERNPHTFWSTIRRVRSGVHTDPRSNDGSGSSDETLPLQLTLADD